MSILIVDDTPSQRLVLTSMLRVAGYSALQVVGSAREAYTCLGMFTAGGEVTDVELILMDISMPEINGIEACQTIKDCERLRDIPIIMVTASNEEGDLEMAFAAGALDYITKPPQRFDLLARLQSALRLKHEMDRRKTRERELVALTRQLTDVNQQLEHALTSLDSKHSQLQAEQERSERLLLNILPRPVAERLKHGQRVIADSFADVTVLFADIVDFSQLSASISPTRLVEMLNDVFSRFDRLAEQHGLEKIKTIGDAYMVVGGLPVQQPNHTSAVADMALDMQDVIADFRLPLAEPHTGIKLRIGIHSGPVIAGVIGQKKFSYDLWGETVNTASRMESCGAAGYIQVSPEAYARLDDGYHFAERRAVEIKGKGEMTTYLLLGRKAARTA